MLLSISVYAGASGGFGETFQWLSLVLFAPVLTFCALPFFRNATSALKGGRLSIDVPIAFGISAGSAGSIWNLFEGSRDIYFDSISGFIFLLLSSRYLLSRVQAKAADATHLLHFLTPSRAERMSADGPFKTVPSDSLNVGDIVEVSGGPIVPVDGVVVLGRTELSRSWMTGESKSVSIGPGDKVLAGSVSETGALQIRTTAAGASTRLGEILRQTDRTLKSKSKAIQIADRMAQYFVPLTFIFIGVGFLFGFRAGFSEGVARAVALAIPLLMSLAIGRLAKRGILVRGADVLEKLSKVKTVFFDKTGTVWQVISRLVRSPG